MNNENKRNVKQALWILPHYNALINYFFILCGKQAEIPIQDFLFRIEDMTDMNPENVLDLVHELVTERAVRIDSRQLVIFDSEDFRKLITNLKYY